MAEPKAGEKWQRKGALGESATVLGVVMEDEMPVVVWRSSLGERATADAPWFVGSYAPVSAPRANPPLRDALREEQWKWLDAIMGRRVPFYEEHLRPILRDLLAAVEAQGVGE